VTLVALFVLAAAQVPAAATEADRMAGRALDVLERRCVRCHGPAKGSGGLRLTDRAQTLAGGEHGPAFAPGQAATSLLLRAVGYQDPDLEMPPSERLPAGEVEVLRAWIERGAPWPAGRRLGAATWWAFTPVRRPAVPPAPEGHSPIDAFVDQVLAARELPVSPEADRRTLIRRATMDLWGLPPTAAEVRVFEEDSRPDAFARLVDRLLASPRYGEQWGRHWLDLVRYSDSAGFEGDPFHLDGWRFRDYVIKSFNDDKPYDRLVKEHLAGDELWPDDPGSRMGTGFLRVGPHRDLLNRNEEVNRIEKLTDLVETTSHAFLGLTVGCARCHDHKFDPLPQRDFFRLQAIFEPAVYDAVVVDYEAHKGWERAQNEREFRLRQMGARLGALRARAREGRGLSPPEAAELGRLEAAALSVVASYTAPATAPGMTDAGRAAPPSFIALRGNPKTPGARVAPGFPAVLGGGDVPEPPETALTTGRRRALAEWLTRPTNPLFARVMVNRLWQLHFGRGLLASPSDFGLRAGSPSHPELLDWLAAELVARGFSLKAMHRLLMNTAAFRRSALVGPGDRDKDPENVHLGRFARRRLHAEELRDSVLFVAGALSPKMGGMPVVTPLEPNELLGIQGKPSDTWPVTWDPSEHTRRSVYLVHLRTFRAPLFEAFDAPDGVASCPRRHESTTAPQSLALLNSRFVVEQAERLASRATSPDDLFLAILARRPENEERVLVDAFLNAQAKSTGSRRRALEELARALLNSNEFLHVE
jgi:cytochrome c553